MSVAGRKAELVVNGLADCADRAVADDGELCANIHSCHEAISSRAGFVDALIGEAEASDCFAICLPELSRE